MYFHHSLCFETDYFMEINILNPLLPSHFLTFVIWPRETLHIPVNDCHLGRLHFLLISTSDIKLNLKNRSFFQVYRGVGFLFKLGLAEITKQKPHPHGGFPGESL